MIYRLLQRPPDEWRHGTDKIENQYTAAVKTSALDDTAKSLAALTDIFKRDAQLPKILAAPTLSAGDKSQIIAELQKHMGGLDKGSTVKNFLNTLADNNRLSILQGICEKFSTIMVAARGEVDLVITSAAVSQFCPSYWPWTVGECTWWLSTSAITFSCQENPSLTMRSIQKLDQKTLQRLETAITKSEYSQGKKLKVVPKVGFHSVPLAGIAVSLQVG